MKIWQAQQFGDPQEVLEQTEIVLPNVSGRAFRLKVHAAGVGLPDLMMTKGVYPLVPKPPASPGQEVVGTVLEAGPDCDFKPGDRVVTTTGFFLGMGGFAEEVVVEEKGPVVSCLAPEALSNEQAAGFLIPYHTVHGALVQRGQLQAGETLLVLGGSGSSGSAAIQIGKAIGAKVIAVAGGAEKAAFCAEIGADHTVDYRKGSIHEQVLALTGKRGVDVIFDPVGGSAGADALKAIGHDGRFVLIGFASGSWTRFEPNDLVGRSYSVVGAFMGNRKPSQVAQAKADLGEWADKGLIRPPVDKVFAFDEVPHLMQRLAKGEMLGKMVLKVSDA